MDWYSKRTGTYLAFAVNILLVNVMVREDVIY